MPRLPLAVWIAIAVALLVLLALCAGVLVAVLRAPARRRIALWPRRVPLVLLVLAAVPWMVAKFAPGTVRISIHGMVGLIGWLLVALVAFALLVLFPLAVVASTLVWWAAWRHSGRHRPPSP